MALKLPEQRAKGRKLLYCAIAMSLAICIIIPIFLLKYNPIFFSVGQNTNANRLAANDTLTTQEPANDSTASPSPSTVNITRLTEDEALKIAMPIINEYATENNRTIISINAAFYANVTDLEGSRGGPSLYNLTQQNISASELKNIQWSSYPEWAISAQFQGVKDYIHGYIVLIWADNGEIRSASPQGNY